MIGSGVSVQFATLPAALDGRLSRLGQGSGGFTHVLIYLLRKDCRQTRRLVERCQAAMSPGGICQVFIHHLHGEAEQGNFSHELVGYVEKILPSLRWTVECSFVGGSLKRTNYRVIAACTNTMHAPVAGLCFGSSLSLRSWRRLL